MVGRRLERSYRRGSRESDRFQKEVFSRVYPERQKEVVLSLQLLELLARNIYFSQGLIVVCQGRQRRDASAAEEAQLGRCSAGRLYLHSDKLTPAAMCLRRVRVVGVVSRKARHR